MTWHAARFLLLQTFALAFAGALVFGAWVFVHRGHRLGPVLRTVLGIVIVGGALTWFTSILRSVLTDGAVVAADRRLHNTLRLFHSEPLHIFFSSISNLAAAIFVIPLAIALAVLFWMHRRTYEAKVFILAIAGAEVLSVALKYIVRRPRPADAAALVGGPSFPSGHTLTATAVYGILMFLLLRETAKVVAHRVGAAAPRHRHPRPDLARLPRRPLASRCDG